MPLRIAEVAWTREGLDGPVKVRWGRVITGESPDLVAAAGDRIFIFTASGQTYDLSNMITVGKEILSLDVGLPLDAKDNIVVGVEDRIIVYGNSQGLMFRVLETEPEPGARFVDLTLADLDGDGREEVVAASEGREAFFVYRLEGEPGQLRLSLLAIRVLPGSAQKVTKLVMAGEPTPAIAAAYNLNNFSGMALFLFTERGFAEGPAQELPVRITSLVSSDLRPKQGEELAWGGNDGSVRVVEVNSTLDTVVTSENLGSAVPALTSGRLPGENVQTLIGGIPEGFLFGFQAPVLGNRPDWAVRVTRPVNDLDVSREGLLGLGTVDGGVRVWLLSTRGRLVHIVLPGETLTTIAAIYNTTAEAIAEINNITDPNLIFPGRKLLIS